MKIAVLNYRQQCVDIVPVSEEDFKNYGGTEESLENGWPNRGDCPFDIESFLCDKGYSLDNIHWMFCGEDPDEIPVYYAEESIPYAVL